jgi:hypothetical protein
MLEGASEAWIFILMIIVIFLHNMLHLVVRHLLQPTTLTVSTHINHVHIALIVIIIVLVIVRLGDNSIIFHEQMNTNFSSPGFNSNSNFFNSD